MAEQRPFWDRNQSASAKRRVNQIVKATGADPKAVRILINTYFDFDKSKSVVPNAPIRTPEDDLQYAIDAGVMMPTEHTTHDDMSKRLVAVRDGLDRKRVANAFVVSLSTNRLDYRSALSYYARHLHYPAHKLDKSDQGPPSRGRTGLVCKVCRYGWFEGEPEVVLDFNGVKLRSLFYAGTPKRPDYALCDLTWFSKEEPAEPTDEQWSVMAAVLDAIRALPDKAELAELNKSLTGLFKSDKNSRQRVLEVLGFCGILQPCDQPDVLSQWIDGISWELHPAYYKREWAHPVQWWTGADGVNDKAVEFWFPRLAK